MLEYQDHSLYQVKQVYTWRRVSNWKAGSHCVENGWGIHCNAEQKSKSVEGLE
jgi:hypothetical protein